MCCGGKHTRGQCVRGAQLLLRPRWHTSACCQRVAEAAVVPCRRASTTRSRSSRTRSQRMRRPRRGRCSGRRRSASLGLLPLTPLTPPRPPTCRPLPSSLLSCMVLSGRPGPPTVVLSPPRPPPSRCASCSCSQALHPGCACRMTHMRVLGCAIQSEGPHYHHPAYCPL